MDALLLRLTLMVYFIATCGYMVHLITMRKDVERIAFRTLLAGTIIHAITIGVRWVRLWHAPFTGMGESLSFLAMLLSGSFLLFQYGHKVKNLGAFVTPIIMLITVASVTLIDHSISYLPPALRSIWLPIHAGLCLVSYAILTLSFSLSVMYLVQEWQIKHKRLGAIFRRLPSLETLDIMAGRSLKVGFPLLTLGIITGAIWAEKAWGAYWSWDPKETWSLITWLVYAALLHQRLTVGWRGRRSAVMTIIGFMVLVFTFFGVTYLLTGMHSYVSGWQ